MSDETNQRSFQANLPDPAATREALAEIFINAAQATRAAAKKALAPPTALTFDPADKAGAMFNFALSLMTQPTVLVEAQQKAFAEWSSLWTATLRRMGGQAADPVIEPARGDRRFSDPAWTEQPLFEHLKQSYLLAGRQMNELVAKVDNVDPDTRLRVAFILRQYLDAVAPTNFALTNPEALRKSLETGGVNLLGGLANLLADVATDKGIVERRAADTFELGVNIAATPGDVVYQNTLFQLIQYAPTTPQVARRPLLYVPPLVNKYYLMDLQPKSSLLKWLVDEGRTVFVVSWVNPGPELRDKDLASYVVEGVVEAMNAVRDATGEPDVDLAAFCMGGTLAACAAAYLAAKGEADRVGSLTMIGTLLEFSDLREWAVFMGAGDMEALHRNVHSKGYIESHDLQKLFSLMRANDLIWSSVVNHYLLDKEAPPSDILYWFADGARIPAAFLRTYGENMLKGDQLKNPGAVVLQGTPLDLGKVTAPVFVISLKDDHVSAWEATYSGARMFGGPARFLLGGSGHNAGVINPPSANKHGFWTNAALPDDAEGWMATAAKQDGSWWPEWRTWLTEQDADTKPARKVGEGKLKAIEPAPGSYVRGQ
ncbi:alpha/beta fold hydrolase [Phenylobacterium sp.]|uniref:alpha/beta fold hydrolase n=1 Tax=Phenylobacterium sp. TaxID=1871053 RepID=UPI0027372CA4|nr:alpha/beta fold hydrolase [Phenylobacterium sp.]MDP3660363.1 alpha/beta fold hydrolase [Phenylobacterium sp.]